MLYFADIKDFNQELDSEMECVELFDALPDKWTYPLIQPLLVQKFLKRSRTKF